MYPHPHHSMKSTPSCLSPLPPSHRAQWPEALSCFLLRVDELWSLGRGHVRGLSCPHSPSEVQASVKVVGMGGRDCIALLPVPAPVPVLLNRDGEQLRAQVFEQSPPGRRCQQRA